MIDEAFDGIIPDLVISGCNLLDFQARVHAALVVGWIHKPVALLIERSYGRGRAVFSTFRVFADEPNVDPTAAALLDAMIGTATRIAPPPEELVGMTPPTLPSDAAARP